MTDWRQLRISLPGEAATTLEEFLLERGAVSVTLLDARDQPIFQREPGATPLWDNVILIGLFPSAADLGSLETDIRANFPQVDSIECVDLEDQDWTRSWMRDFHPMQFGKRLWICPSWETPPNPEAINIRLDPGLAFGSGTHATTGLCLRWLEQHSLPGKQLVDYGCGSGVLAIAAVLLGADRAIGVDNDPQAITATVANREQNAISPEQLPVLLPEQLRIEATDILLANILAEPLLELAQKFATLLKEGGELVLSGILREQQDMIVSHYRTWFEFNPVQIDGDWVLLYGIRRSGTNSH